MSWEGARWQDAYVNQLDSWVLPPKDQRIQQQNAQLVAHFDFALLPILDNQSNVNMAAFDYTSIDWRGFDLAKHILQASHHEQSYLQVYVSDNLIKDELYRQVEATEDLYRYGKVVWGVVIKSDAALTEPMSEEERDTPFANHRVSCADILFDPSGQAAPQPIARSWDEFVAAKQPNRQVEKPLAKSWDAFIGNKQPAEPQPIAKSWEEFTGQNQPKSQPIARSWEDFVKANS